MYDLITEVKVGDRVVVGDWHTIPVTVSQINQLEDNRVRLDLDWGEHGTSYVFLHDRKKTWYKYEEYPFLN